MQYFQTLWENLVSVFYRYVMIPVLHMGWMDVMDILLLSVLLYETYRFSRTRRAGRVMVGLLVVVFVSMIVTALKLPALTYIIRLFSSVIFFCVVLIFQPEIRDALERIGNARIVAPRSDSLPRRQLPAARQVTEETVDAVYTMSRSCTGALIVFEGLTALGEYMEHGYVVDARVTSRLMQNIFFDKAPLHDGALIIRNMKIWCASCVLPSTKSDMDFGNMGTRHRAAVGLTEVSDALVIVVSEQTGTVSVAQDGKLIRGVSPETLSEILMTYLAGSLYLRSKKQEAKAAKEPSESAGKKFATRKKSRPVPATSAEEPDSDPQTADPKASQSQNRTDTNH